MWDLPFDPLGTVEGSWDGSAAPEGVAALSLHDLTRAKTVVMLAKKTPLPCL